MTVSADDVAFTQKTFLLCPNGVFRHGENFKEHSFLVGMIKYEGNAAAVEEI